MDCGRRVDYMADESLLFLERSEIIWQKKRRDKKGRILRKGESQRTTDVVCTVTWIAVVNIRRCTVGGWWKQIHTQRVKGRRMPYALRKNRLRKTTGI